jgi:hypothetical protein
MNTSLRWGIAFLLFMQTTANAQLTSPGIKWQRPIGGTGYDRGGFIDLALAEAPKMSLQDRDGGYLIAGDVTSTNGDIIGNHGGYECFVAKLDSARNIVWSICLGGSANENLGSLSLAHDSGYILTGNTSSVDGNLLGNHGFDDAWVVRLDTKGNILWQKCYGGSSTDRGMHIAPAGSGYIMLGTTTSHDGDVPYAHLYNYNDLWVVRLDSVGNILWQQLYGGYGLEDPSVIKQTPDSGFIVAAHTNFQDFNVTGPHGSNYDIWILKLDAAGNLEWEKFLGGTGKESAGDIEIHPLGGYLVAGITTSSDGDVTGFHGPATKSDAWVVRLSATGNILWQKCYGGTDTDILSDIEILPDHSFVAAGTTYSVDGDVSTKRGNGDCWLVACNPDGNLLWEKTFGGSDFDGANALTITQQGTYLVAGSTASNDQDVSGSHGSSDMWLFEAGAINTITGIVFYDANNDGIRNNGEQYFDKVTVWAEKGSVRRSAIPLNGNYRIDVDTGTYAVQGVSHSPYYQVVPASQTVTFNNYYNVDSFHFGVQKIPGITDLYLSFYSSGQVWQGQPSVYVAWFKNQGTEVSVSGQIKIKLDPRFSVHHTTPPYDSVRNDTMIWNYSHLLPNTGSSVQLQLTAATSPVLNIGDTVTSFGIVVPDGNEITPEDNKVLLRHRVTGYSDPLPITLVSFQATPAGTAVNVSWKTSMEQNGKQYEVQRSVNGVDFKTIGIVKTGLTAYLFTDKEPLAGYNYYRLRSVDLDGSYTYSTIVLVNMQHGADIISSMYPNPGNGNIIVKLQGAIQGNIVVQVLDQQGRVLLTKPFGHQHTTLFSMPMDIGYLPKGNYMLNILVDVKKHLHKLLIQ